MDLRQVLNLELLLTSEPRKYYGVEERVFLVKKVGESLDHVLMKFLSFVLFYEPELEIERSVGQHYKPDLVRVGPDGAVLQWIDCGSTSFEKLERIVRENSQAQIVIVKPYPRELELYQAAADERLSDPERVTYVAFERGYLARLRELVGRRHRVTAVVTPEYRHLYLSIDGVPTETSVLLAPERFRRMLGRPRR